MRFISFILLLFISSVASSAQIGHASMHTEANKAYQNQEYELALDMLAGKFDVEALSLQAKCYFQIKKHDAAEATLNHYFGVNKERGNIYNEMISLKTKIDNIKLAKVKPKAPPPPSMTDQLKKEVSGAVESLLNQIKPFCESIISN